MFSGHEHRQLVITCLPDDLRKLADQLEKFGRFLKLGDSCTLPQSLLTTAENTDVVFALPANFKLVKRVPLCWVCATPMQFIEEDCTSQGGPPADTWFCKCGRVVHTKEVEVK